MLSRRQQNRHKQSSNFARSLQRYAPNISFQITQQAFQNSQNIVDCSWSRKQKSLTAKNAWSFKDPNARHPRSGLLVPVGIPSNACNSDHLRRSKGNESLLGYQTGAPHSKQFFPFSKNKYSPPLPAASSSPRAFPRSAPQQPSKLT